MANFINTADVIGDDELCDQFILRTVTEYKENRITNIGPFAFFNCNALATVDVPNVKKIETQAFAGAKLLALILRNTTQVCSLSSTDALRVTSIQNGTGYIYVPTSLYNAYASASNWSAYSAQLRKLEDYTVDGTTTGELDKTKI